MYQKLKKLTMRKCIVDQINKYWKLVYYNKILSLKRNYYLYSINNPDAVDIFDGEQKT